MEVPLRSLVSFSKTVLRKSTNHPCNLPDLPYELLHIIALDLSTQDLCSLSLVCKHLYAIFQSSEPFKLICDIDAKRKFLEVLEGDLSDYLLCFSCDQIYRWRVPGSKEPLLCPNRATRPHLTYKHLDFQHHDRSVEREIIDLARLRHIYGRKYGVPFSYLLRRLQGKERLNKSLRVPAASMVSGCWMPHNRILIQTKIEVRIRKGDTTHPFLPFTEKVQPEGWKEIPSTEPLVHGRLSSLTRLLGCNIHDDRARTFSLGKDGKYARFYMCRQCQTSVQVSVRKFKKGWFIVSLKTAQNMGTTREAAEVNTLVAGLCPSHKEIMPSKKLKILNCDHMTGHHGETQAGPFCTLSSDAPEGAAASVPLHDDLGVMAWFQRHKFLYEEKMWPRRTIPLTGYCVGYPKRKYLVPWLFWTLPTAFLWDLPKIFIWEVPKIFVWDWPKEALTDYRSQRAGKKARKLAETAPASDTKVASSSDGTEAAHEGRSS